MQSSDQCELEKATSDFIIKTTKKTSLRTASFVMNYGKKTFFFNKDGKKTIYNQSKQNLLLQDKPLH